VVMKEAFIRAALEALRDFGYRSLSEDRVRTAYEKVVGRGEKPADVIEMWVKDLWEKYGGR